MNNDDIYEKFEITEWDINNEFNPNRNRRRLSKKQQIYGVFASDSDDDGDDYKGRDSTNPISFVSGGLKEDNDIKAKDDNANDDTVEDHKNVIKGEELSNERQSFNYANNSMGVPTKQFAGFRGSGVSSFISAENIGEWEKYTKGIGAKLLQKMGYESGKGLGKNLQGITAPIEAKKRPGSGALGLYGAEHKQKKKYAGEIPQKEQIDSEIRHLKIKSERKQKREETHAKRIQYVMKSADDVISEGLLNPSWSDASKVKVIDMTGPEQKVLSGYHEIHQQRTEGINQDDHIENNLGSLKEIADNDLRENERELQRDKEKYQRLDSEKVRLEELIDKEKQLINNIEKLLNIIDSLSDGLKNNTLTIEDAINKYCDAQKQYPIEFVALDLQELLIPAAFPLIEMTLKEWQPFDNASNVFKLFERLNSVISQKNESIFELLLWEIWMPIVRRELIRWPSMRQCDNIVTFLEKWKEVIPDWLMDNIMDQIVLPRIQKEVEEWNPLTDIVPIHSWLHPWLPLMGDRSLDHIYAPIRHKLANALTNWHPSDSSARLILEPWKDVFSAGTMEAFLNINIVPKLELAMQNFVINPHEQRLDIWHWVMSWQNILSAQTLGCILEKYFFPQFHSVLYNWLSNVPNYDEISKWFLGWKSMITEPLLNQPSVKDSLKRALDMMNHAVSAPAGIKSFPILPDPVLIPREIPENLRPPESGFIANPIQNIAISFKQLVERKAEEHGILFMPIPNRFQESKQVYRFGSNTILIDRQVLFIFNNGNWIPISLQSLIDSSM